MIPNDLYIQTYACLCIQGPIYRTQTKALFSFTLRFSHLHVCLWVCVCDTNVKIAGEMLVVIVCEGKINDYTVQNSQALPFVLNS